MFLSNSSLQIPENRVNESNNCSATEAAESLMHFLSSSLVPSNAGLTHLGALGQNEPWGPSSPAPPSSLCALYVEVEPRQHELNLHIEGINEGIKVLFLTKRTKMAGLGLGLGTFVITVLIFPNNTAVYEPRALCSGGSSLDSWVKHFYCQLSLSFCS